MNRYLLGLGIAALASVATAFVMTASPVVGPRALVVEDLGLGYDDTVSHMIEEGWTVEAISWNALLKRDGAALRLDHDVVWVLPDAEYDPLRQLAERGAVLEDFARAGGAVVLLGVNADESRLDIAPGGLDCLHSDSCGSTTIAAESHVLITGGVTGGNQLDAADLDPAGDGGGGFLANAPEECNPVAIACNSEGDVLCEYELGEGIVLLSLLDLSGGECLCNVLRTIQWRIQ